MRRNIQEALRRAYNVPEDGVSRTPVNGADGSVSEETRADLRLINVSTGRGTVDFQEMANKREEDGELLRLLSLTLKSKP